MKFRVLEGQCSVLQLGAKMDPVSRDIPATVYRKGDVVTPTKYDPQKGEVVLAPESDLCAKFNVPGYAPKFERVYENVGEAAQAGFNTAFTDTGRQPNETPRQTAERLRKMAAELETSDPLPLAPQPDPTIDSMTLEELKKVAAEEEIELPANVKDRGTVIKLVKQGLAKHVGAK